MSLLDHDDEEDVLPVPLDRKTRAWLAALSREIGAPVGSIVASMLHDIRIDDERLHTLN